MKIELTDEQASDLGELLREALGEGHWRVCWPSSGPEATRRGGSIGDLWHYCARRPGGTIESGRGRVVPPKQWR